MIRTAYLIFWIVLATFILSIAAIIASFFSSTGNSVHLVARFWAKSILFVSRIKVSVKGLSNLDSSGPFVYMCNHQSYFDVLILLAYLPVQFRWLAKAELFKIPIFARAMRGAGYISIDRYKRESAFKSIDRAADKIRGGVSLMIFPEGTRSRDGSIGPFKKGGFVLSLKSGVPIVPIIINGARAIMQKGSLHITPGDVELIITRPIDTTDYSLNTRDDLVELVRNVICGEFKH
jgi:1-acyl-sn-glycerol-3-phosphate acyltransferase